MAAPINIAISTRISVKICATQLADFHTLILPCPGFTFNDASSYSYCGVSN